MIRKQVKSNKKNEEEFALNIDTYIHKIDKKLLHKTKTIGVTELLSLKCKILNGSEVMLIYNKKLSVVPITTHINIRNVPKKLKSTLIGELKYKTKNISRSILFSGSL